MLDAAAPADIAAVKLGAVAQINPRLDARLDPDEVVPFVPMAAVSAVTAGIEAEETRPYAEVSKGYTAFRDGDVLVAKITPCFENNKIAHARLSGPVGFGSTEFHVIRADPHRLDPRYVLHFLRQDHVRAEGERKMTGSAGQRRVPAQVLADLSLPLPPLDEQRRIAGILDEAGALRAKRQAALAQLDEMARAIFLETVGDPLTNPNGFDHGNIETMVADAKRDVRCGPFGTQLKVGEIVDEGIPLLGIENVLNDRFVPSSRKFLTAEKAKQLAAFDVQAGDVLVTRMGTIGRACVVPADFVGGRFSYHLFRIRPDQGRCLPKFLVSTIVYSGSFQEQLAKLAHGAIMDGLSTGDLKAVRFLLPPFAIQERLNAQFAELEAARGHATAAAQQLDSLFAALQHRAFRGEL